jgi:hypothetical protein
MKKKKTTIEDLAGMIKGTEKRLGADIEKLAVLVVNRFDEVDKRFNGVERRLDGVEGRLGKVEEGVDKLKGRMAAVEYGQYEIQKKLDIRPTNFEVGKLEQKLTAKFERRFQKIEAKVGIKQRSR